MLTMSDHLCGGGGSSSGAEMVPGVRVRIAINHWQLAIDTHNLNLPHVDHDLMDMALADPRRYPATDIAWFSPECTTWSQANSAVQDFARPDDPSLFDDDRPLPKAAVVRSRALMEDVPRFAEHHRYRAVIVENVTDILKWTGLPKWKARMRRLGYRCQTVTLNSAFAHQLGAPAPQLRDRAYFLFTLEIYPAPDIQRWTRPQAWCPTCDQVVTAMYAPKNPDRPLGRYGQQYVYRCPSVTCRNAVVHPYTLPAAAVIDWSNPGTRIGDRAKPLAPKTMARIEAGLRRYAVPITVEAAGHTFERRPGVRSWPVHDPLKTLHTTASKALACPPLLVPVEGRDGKTARLAAAPHRAQTARNETALLVPAGGTWNDAAWPVTDPMRTRTARENEGVVLIPLRNNNRPKSVREPLDTFAANGFHHGLARVLPARAAGQALAWDPTVLMAYDTGSFRSLTHPLPTQTTVEGDALLAAGITIEDCLFRMLLIEEIKLGMAFAPGFQLLGTKREQARLCGNAVTPPAARDLVACVVEAITGDDIYALAA